MSDIATMNDVVQAVESLAHHHRVRYMVDMGRQSRRDAIMATTLLELSRSDNFYHRYLAVMSCYGSQDGTLAFQFATQDVSQKLQDLGIVLLVQIGDCDQVLSVLETLSPKQQWLMIKQLGRHKKQAIIDAFLERCLTEGREHVARLLSYGSDAVVRSYFARLCQDDDDSTARMTATVWKRLARRHPEATVKVLQDEDGPFDYDEYNIVIPHLARSAQPLAAMQLCQEMANTTLARVDDACMTALIRRCPNAMANLVVAQPVNAYRSASCNYVAVVRKIEPSSKLATLSALVERGCLPRPEVWFRKIASPSMRGELYQAHVARWRNDDGLVSIEIVQKLPRDLRVEQALLHVNLAVLQTRPPQLLPYVALLPWDEGRVVLQPFLHNPDAELRQLALEVLIASARFNRDHVGDVLREAILRRNEQDPVRGSILSAMAKLPPGIWQTHHLSDLTQILEHARNAADLSFGTGSAAELLVMRLLAFFTEWAAEQLALLVKVRGQLSCRSLDTLSHATVQQMAPFLIPVLEAWDERDSSHQLVALASCFGRRLKSFVALVEIVERIVRDTKIMGWISSRGLQVLSIHHRERLHVLIPELLLEDESWISESVVQLYLHRNRQDLLGPLLSRKAVQGRFMTGKTFVVVGAKDGFHRWTSAQQQVFAEGLVIGIEDEWQNHAMVFRLMATLGALPVVAPTRLIQLAQLDTTNVAFRDRALQILARRDNDDGIPVLLQAMDDDRARIAIYALRKSILAMPPPQALVLLRQIPRIKVTVAKEVVRLVGEFTTEEAYQELLAWNQQTELHRDVRVALLRSFWLHLRRNQTWTILQEAAVSSDSAIATMASRTPYKPETKAVEDNLAFLFATILNHSDPLVRLAVLERCESEYLVDTNRRLLQPLLRALQSELHDESVAAAKAYCATYQFDENPTMISQAVEQVLPNRRLLQTFLDVLEENVRRNDLHTTQTVLESLAKDPLVAWLRIQFAAATLPTVDLIQFLRQNIDTLASEMLDRIEQSMHKRAVAFTDLDEFLTLETSLVGQSDFRLRRLALTALVAQAKIGGWTDERRERILVYQRDADPTVSSVAQFIFPH